MKDKKKIIVYLVSITLIAVLSIMAFLMYDKPTNKVIEYNYNISKRKTIQNIDNGQINAIVDTKGNAYLVSFMDIESIDDSVLKDGLINLSNHYTICSIDGYLQSFLGYKLDISNVLASYYLNYHDTEYFFFLYENGKVSYINLDELINDKNIVIKKIDNLDNVIALLDNGYDFKPYFITISGDELPINNYIK